jgi:DNA helicase-2/ATP-dependent DNA helicase PcrA
VIDTDQLLADLTPEQVEAAKTIDGPLLVVAGAGSGKTRVITRRVAYIIAQGIPAASICAITFTNKAAGEMKQRVSQVLNWPMRDFGRLDQQWPTICTFHSLCLRILRHYAPAVGLPANFTIFDSSDQTKVVKEALKALEMSSTNFTPSSVHAAISDAKNKLQTPEQFSQQAGDFFQKQVARVYHKYDALMKASNALDFDDLLLRTCLAFRDAPDVLREVQNRFQYLMIDEYQDTNHAQYILAHAMAQRHQNICVVGDPDQSIYAWRGADIRNILEFERDYPSAKIVRLERNYRSTKTILHVASTLIEKNSQRKKKTLWTENPQGEKVRLVLCQNEYDEAEVVAKWLKELHDKHGIGWNDMAVFYRMNALSRVMEDALRRENLPYVMARGVEFYSRKEIKDTLAYLRVVSNPSDEVNLTRIVNTPTRGISDSTVERLQAFAIGRGISLFEAMRRAASVEGLTVRAANSCQAFVRMIEEFRAKADGQVQPVLEYIVRNSGLEAYYKKEGGEEQEQLANIGELITSASEYDAGNPEGSLTDYLTIISLVSDVDHLKDNGGAITMMTLHAAKGLEFPAVAMIGLEEGVLPHARARGDLNQLEEERRLCFVGITRAEQRLLMTRAAYRTIRGLRERTVSSPFLGEIPLDVCEVLDRTSLATVPPRGSTTELESSYSVRKLPFKQGDMVRHPTFGVGKIDQISDMGTQTRAVIQFSRAGRKTLILEYARLEAVQ